MAEDSNLEEKTQAAALRYNIEKDDAPVIVAQGQGELARQIIQLAEENDIPLEEDKDLVKVLLQLELEEEIPEELYQAVAEILSFVLELDELA
jgi:flagellar biosynthesis protein